MASKSDTEKLISLKTYAKNMGVSRQTVYNQLEKGTVEVPPVEGRKPPKWRPADIAKYLLDKAAKQTAEAQNILADGQ